MGHSMADKNVCPAWVANECSNLALWLLFRLEEHKMLPGKLFDLLDQLEAVGRPFLKDLLLRHLVERLDGHSWVLGPEFDQGHPAARLEALSHGGQHLFGIRKLVV